ncbi:MAG: hypothetical protein SAJ12_18990 [Jaaginema sp. PMC 1079.18]|nr:hypothetical protein [Jaaginema sp. PMC 1080.18]MEC4853073.1 hypothetical protein [Jaaginema sp. PMC 1079.18]MEC4865057.1 hypothetical protein [Jaaginema sp. PMC 1078.18]
MSSFVELIPGAIAALFATTSDTGYLTQTDRYGLLAAILDETFALEEQEAVNRILHGIRTGKLQLID